jgi:hypothetical protein
VSKLNCQEQSKFCKFISKRRIISIKDNSILRRISLNFIALRRLFQFSQFFPRISKFFDLSITEETWIVEMRIWCIKIVLHFNLWVEASVGGLLVPEGRYSPLAKYFGICFKIRNWTVKKEVNVNSSQNEGLSPSGIAQSFDGFGSISWHSV